MATAITNTIPCDRCEAQIDLEDWSSHVRQCNIDTKQSPRNTNDNEKHESMIEGIPCEYCHVQIDLNDWESHSKQCQDLHKRHIEKTKQDEDDETTTTIFIPCEYCNESIDIHKYEWHTKLCGNKKEKNTVSTMDVDLMEAMIPCEYCGRQVLIDDYQLHTHECAEAEKRRADEITNRNGNNSIDAIIPCQYCDKLFSFSSISDHQNECRQQLYTMNNQGNISTDLIVGGTASFPDTWTWNTAAMNNLSVHTLQTGSDEYKFVSGKFHETLPSNQIIKIERIQNKRWYRQYEAHRDDFIERYGKSTEQWLFHGCKSQSTNAIMNDCFNRSHAVRCAAGQGIYFAAQASTSLSYTQPDSSNQRHMFMARVLIGKTAPGNQSTRVCPPGFDTTGGGTVFVTYHDAQAYGEYLITFH